VGKETYRSPLSPLIRRSAPRAAAGAPLPLALRSNAAPAGIVFLMADDPGYGDLSCYGRRDFRTPNINQIAAGDKPFLQGVGQLGRMLRHAHGADHWALSLPATDCPGGAPEESRPSCRAAAGPSDSAFAAEELRPTAQRLRPLRGFSLRPGLLRAQEWAGFDRHGRSVGCRRQGATRPVTLPICWVAVRSRRMREKGVHSC